MSSNKGRNSHQKRELKDKLFRGKASKPCCFCKQTVSKYTATLEHVIPLSDGGGWNIENLRVSCKDCNQKRGNINFVDFLMKSVNEEVK